MKSFLYAPFLAAMVTAFGSTSVLSQTIEPDQNVGLSANKVSCTFVDGTGKDGPVFTYSSLDKIPVKGTHFIHEYIDSNGVLARVTLTLKGCHVRLLGSAPVK